MARPRWSTNTNHPAGGNPWNNQPTKVEPSSGKKDGGFVPDTDVPAEEVNWVLNDGLKWAASASLAVYGDGSDGSATLDGVNTVAWASLAANVYTMNRDVFLNDLTITGSGVRLRPNGFRIFGRGTLTTASGAVISQEPVGSGSGGITDGATGTILGGKAGATGTNGVGAAGSNAAASMGGNAGAGGNHTGSGNNGGAGGTATAPTAAQGSPRATSAQLLGHVVGIAAGASATVALTGGAGGGAGGGNGGGNTGGDGGRGGSVTIIAFRELNLAAASNIDCHGVNGKLAVSSGGGGGGGGGGFLLLIYSAKNNVTFSAATNCPGGAGAAGDGGTGQAGSAGANGTVIEIVMVAA